jgi:hypothetical protein
MWALPHARASDTDSKSMGYFHFVRFEDEGLANFWAATRGVSLQAFHHLNPNPFK